MTLNPFAAASADTNASPDIPDVGAGRQRTDFAGPSVRIGHGNVVHEKPLAAFIPDVPDKLCVATAEFNPFQFWYKDSEDLEKWSKQITDAIETAVERYHRGFNQATTEFDEILLAFHDSEVKFKRLIGNLCEAKKLLSQSRGDRESGKKGNTASIAEQWETFEFYKKKLKELDKIEYILEVPAIFEKYLNKKQFIHSTVLLEDALSLYATSLAVDSSQQLQSQHQMILNRKHELEQLLAQQLSQQIYFKTNSLRANLLRPPKRKPNKNILNLLNFQKEMMLLDEDMHSHHRHNQKRNMMTPNLLSGEQGDKLSVAALATATAAADDGKQHFKNQPTVHYDTLASLNQERPSIAFGASQHKNKFKASRKNPNSAYLSAGVSTANSMQEPYKIIVPTYKSFRNLDEVKDDSVEQQMSGNVQHLLVAETDDEYLKLAHNNNNYNDDEQPLFLTICVTAIDKLGRAVGAKTNLFKHLESELKEIVEREIYEVVTDFQQQMIQSNAMSNLIEPEDQSMMLLNATQNVFKIFTRVLSNHKTVLTTFDQSQRTFVRKQSQSQQQPQPQTRGRSRDRDSDADKLQRLQSYTIQSVWNGVQKAVLQRILKRYLDQSGEPSRGDSHSNLLAKDASGARSNDLLDTGTHGDDDILRVRSSSRSASPQPPSSSSAAATAAAANGDGKSSKSFANRLKGNKFFKRARGLTASHADGAVPSSQQGHAHSIEIVGDDADEYKNGHGGASGDMSYDTDRGDLFASNIAAKYHDFAMDSLTFSFADSNVGSVVHRQEGMSTNKVGVVAGRGDEFGMQHRMSISNANAHLQMNLTTRAGAPSIANFGHGAGPTRDRGTTGLDAFSSTQRQRRGISTYHHGGGGGANLGGSSKRKMTLPDHHDDDSKKQAVSRQSSAANSKQRRKAALKLIEASPYHVTKLYKPIIHFVENAEWKILTLFGGAGGGDDKLPNRRQMDEAHEQRKKDGLVADEVDLRDFLKSFVKETFIPHMQAEAYYNMGEILLVQQPMEQIRIADESLMLLRSTDGIFNLIKTLFEYFVVLPAFDSQEFVQMVEKILSNFRDTYQQAIDEIVEILISRDLILSDKHYVRLLNAYQLRALFENADKDKDKEREKEIELLQQISSLTEDANHSDSDMEKDVDLNASSAAKAVVDKYAYETVRDANTDLSIQHYLLLDNENRIPRSHSGLAKFNTEYFNKLASISTGLFWMSKKINAELITPVMHRASGKHRERSLTRDRLHKSTQSQQSLAQLSKFLADEFEPRAEQCLSIVRMEVRAQIVCLLKNVSKHNYWLPDDSIINKPQDFIIELNKLLVSLEGKLSGCLPDRCIRFLFEEIAYFVCEVIIDQIPRVQNEKINLVGYKQMYKNTFSLQQNLTTITHKGMEKCFDRAQKYLKLSQKTPADIEKIQEIKNKKSFGADKEKYAAYDFSREQYAAIKRVAKLSNAHRK